MADRDKRDTGRTNGDAARGDGTQVLRRAVTVLRLVAQTQRTGATLAAITRATDLSRSTAFRIVHFLTEERLLEFDPDSGSYRVGSLAFELGLAAGGHARFVDRWEKWVKLTSFKTGMTAYLVTRSDADIVCLAKEEAPAILRAVPLVIGQRYPLGLGSGSLAILAALKDAEVQAIIDANRDQLGGYVQGDQLLDELWGRIDEVRRKGYAFSEGSIVEGVAGISIVIPDEHRVGQIALGVSAPAAQFQTQSKDEIAKLVRQHILLGLGEITD